MSDRHLIIGMDVARDRRLAEGQQWTYEDASMEVPRQAVEFLLTFTNDYEERPLETLGHVEPHQAVLVRAEIVAGELRVFVSKAAGSERDPNSRTLIAATTHAARRLARQAGLVLEPVFSRVSASIVEDNAEAGLAPTLGSPGEGGGKA